jgi:hypothetical protein
MLAKSALLPCNVYSVPVAALPSPPPPAPPAFMAEGDCHAMAERSKSSVAWMRPSGVTCDVGIGEGAVGGWIAVRNDARGSSDVS